MGRAWHRFLSRPEMAYALAQVCIDVDPGAPHHAPGVERGWAHLIRALAQCRLLGHPTTPHKILADFTAAAHIFRAERDKRGLRLTELGPAAIAMRMGQWPAARREFEALIGRFDLNTLDPDNFYLCFGLSTAYVYEGRLEESLRFGYAALPNLLQLSRQSATPLSQIFQ